MNIIFDLLLKDGLAKGTYNPTSVCVVVSQKRVFNVNQPPIIEI